MPTILKKLREVKEVKLSLLQAVEACMVVRRRGSHISLSDRLTEGGEVVSRPPPPEGRFLVLIRVRS
jgi:hypothetical protein